jgi:N-acetylmuramoyl-L-alanine amidase
MAKKVYIGVGHGGSDPGAVANGIKEKDVNLDVALACYTFLVKHGVSVKISRTKDTEVWIEKRVKEANSFGADLAVDIHHNASNGNGDGAEIYHTKHLGKGATLARNILAEMQLIGQNSRGAKIKKNSLGEDYFAFVRDTTMPAVLCECAFLDNKTDVKIIDTKAERVKMGEAIAKGILKTLGVAVIVEKPATTEKKTIYTVQVGAYVNKANAEAQREKLKKAGFDGYIVTK